MPQTGQFRLSDIDSAMGTSLPAPTLDTSAPAPAGVGQFRLADLDPAPAGMVRPGMGGAMVNGRWVPAEDDTSPSVQSLLDRTDLQLNQPSWMSPAVGYLTEALQGFNLPKVAEGAKSIAHAPYEALTGHVPDVIKLIGQAQGGLAMKARKSFEEGDYAAGTRHAINFMIPLLGPRLDEAGDLMSQGQYARGMGAATDVGVQAFGPTATKGAKVADLPALAANPNPIEAAAVEAGMRAGVPVDAATATGNPFVRGIQRIGEHTSLLGAREGQIAAQAQAEGLGRWGSQLAERAAPGAGPVSLEQAGQGVRSAVSDVITKLHAEAGNEYGALRTIERDPANLKTVQVGTKTVTSPVVGANGKPITSTVPVTQQIALPLDMSPLKTALAPVLDEMKARMPIAQQQASAGLRAIENIVNGPDHVSLSSADASLSAIKRIAREAESPELRNVSQGLASKAIGELDQAVRNTAAGAGPKALKALEDGRAAVKAKYAAADTLKALSDEPVKVAQQLTARGDAGVEQLRAVAKLAPAEMPKIGRALLENMVERATSEGGFKGAVSLKNEWDKIGIETRGILFKDPALVRELDHFFTLAKKMNPSLGSPTAYLLGAGAHGFTLHDPVSFAVQEITGQQLVRLMHSRDGVKALTRGLTVTLGNKAAAGAAYSNILEQIGAAWDRPIGAAPALVPAVAGPPQAKQ